MKRSQNGWAVERDAGRVGEMIVGNEPELPKPEKSSRGLVVRAELVIATLALVASACASIAAILQTRKSAIETQATLEQTKIVSKQLGSSLWPYLSFAHSLSPTSVKIGFTNDGLGPALIRSFTIVLDDRPITRLHSVIDLVDPKTRGRRVGESDFGRSSVLRPSEGLTIISISDPRFNDTRAERGPCPRALRRVLLLATRRLLVPQIDRYGAA